MNFEDKLKRIEQLISNKFLPKLKKFFKKNNILANDFNNFEKILIYAIENDTSVEILIDYANEHSMMLMVNDKEKKYDLYPLLEATYNL